MASKAKKEADSTGVALPEVGDIVLFCNVDGSWSPAVVNNVNEDASIDLTVFLTRVEALHKGSAVAFKANIEPGTEPENWKAIS